MEHMSDEKIGPNLKRLMIERASLTMIPSGIADGFGAAVKALTTPGVLSQHMRDALTWATSAIALMKTAPDNQWGDDAEAIAGEILKRITEKRLTEKRRNQVIDRASKQA
jgi:hypothetical protein